MEFACFTSNTSKATHSMRTGHASNESIRMGLEHRTYDVQIHGSRVMTGTPGFCRIE